MSSDLSVRVESLGKRYEIYAKPADRLKQMLLPKVQRLFHRREHAYFEQFWALRDASFAVESGETVGIIGSNGSGKSTLLQMICGTLHPTTGKVETSGRIAALLELGAGFNPEFTGRENINLSGLLYGISDTELHRRYSSIVEFADIGEFIDQPVKTYSSGMYVRLAFAIAAHVDAKTLVIDEALSVGDVRFTQKCMRYLRDFQKRGTLLFVSHDSGAVVNLCSRAIWLDKGRLVMDGPARNVVEEYLAAQHASDRASNGDVVTVPAITASAPKRATAAPVVGSETHAAVLDTAAAPMSDDVADPRQSALNGAGVRNLMDVFAFDPESQSRRFGAGLGRITNVCLQDADGVTRETITGGEIVDLVVEAEVSRRVEAPIIGFHVKDRLGQLLFGDNTFLTYNTNPVLALPGRCLRAHFRFRMPILPNGDYSVDAAFATGTQDDHTQQDWVFDALTFRSVASTLRHGLVGIPMRSIEIECGDGKS